MSHEWTPGTIDPKNNLTRGPVVNSWCREIPQEETALRPEQLQEQIENLIEHMQISPDGDYANYLRELYRPKPSIKEKLIKLLSR